MLVIDAVGRKCKAIAVAGQFFWESEFVSVGNFLGQVNVHNGTTVRYHKGVAHFALLKENEWYSICYKMKGANYIWFYIYYMLYK